MKIIDTLRQRLEGLLTAPRDELGRWARFVRYQIHLWRFCGRRLREHNAMAMSSALSFRTIFALIPTLVLALLVMKSVGMVDSAKASLRAVLTRGGFYDIAHVQAGEAPAGEAPRTQPVSVSAGEKIEEYVAKVERQLTFGAIGPVGVVLLIWTALTLLSTIEGSLNRIFGAPRRRALGRRVLLYWSAVSLGPVLLAATAYLGGKAAEAVANVPALSAVLAAANWAGPAIVGIVLLAALYKLMPNTTVRYRAAIGGAVVAVPLWMLAKWGFAVYIREVVGQRSLYGTMGVLPLFMLWLNLSWTIFLFGAELANTAANLRRMQSAELAENLLLGPADVLAAALAVGSPYVQGQGAVPLEEVCGRLRLPTPSVRKLLDLLASAGVVAMVEDGPAGGYVLARPAEKVVIQELMEIGQFRPQGAPGRYAPEIARTVARVGGRARQALGGMTLADVLAENESA